MDKICRKEFPSQSDVIIALSRWPENKLPNIFLIEFLDSLSRTDILEERMSYSSLFKFLARVSLIFSRESVINQIIFVDNALINILLMTLQVLNLAI